MMKANSTKHYSSRQEKMVAEYLGWDVVSGSGARPFNPGDIRSDRYLGECKTFTKESDTIYCYHSVWSKISTEAKSVMRQPILFVDNGTQKEQHTWCIVKKSAHAMLDCIKIIPCSDALKTTSTRVRFSNSFVKSLVRSESSDGITCIEFKLSGDSVLLLPLSSFKSILEDQ